MKGTKKQAEYKAEPKDGMELPEDLQVLTRDEEKAIGFQPPSVTSGQEWDRIEGKNRVILKSRRGGKRPGAGRKPKRHVRMQILVSKATKANIRRLAKKRGVSMSAVVSDAFKK